MVELETAMILVELLPLLDRGVAVCNSSVWILAELHAYPIPRSKILSEAGGALQRINTKHQN